MYEYSLNPSNGKPNVKCKKMIFHQRNISYLNSTKMFSDETAAKEFKYDEK